MGTLTAAGETLGEACASALPWDLPALTQLESFVAIAEADGVDAAAERLRIAPVTLARRVDALQRQLGVDLFRHAPSGIQLSDDGCALLQSIRAGLEQIVGTCRRLRQSQSSTPLTISAPEHARQYWLSPLLPRLAAEFPDCRIDCVGEQTVAAERLAGIDLSICAAGSLWSGLPAERLFALSAFPVLAADAPERSADDAPRLGFAFRDGDIWQAWQLRCGRTQSGEGAVRSFPQAAAAWRACARGEGRSIGLWPWVQPWIDQGVLRRDDSGPIVPVGEAYLVSRPNPNNSHRLSAVHGWLRQALIAQARPLQLSAAGSPRVSCSTAQRGLHADD